MKKYTGSIVKRGDSFHWRYKTIDGKYTTRTIKHPEGGRVTTMVEAERIVTKWSAELTSLHQLKSKEEIIQHIAEVKEIVDQAIANAESGVLKIAFSILTSSRFDEEDYVILHEKDFNN